MRLFYFPSISRKGVYKNPYSQHYKDALLPFFDVIKPDKRKSCMSSLSLLFHSFDADVYVLNWVEALPHLRLGLIQFIITYLSLVIIKMRKTKIIWMFHNIVPHEGETTLTRSLSKWLFKNADIIISHSKEATNYAQQRSSNKVFYRCHPVTIPRFDTEIPQNIAPLDVFIWGEILPYKGIYEFVSNPLVRNSDLKIKIVGRCKDKILNDKIKSCITPNIQYENKRADFSEIAAFCKVAKYVLFPYRGNSVSSSGVLIDTIAFGGCPLGPNVGAFKDMAEEGVCSIYHDEAEMIHIILNGRLNTIIDENREKFIDDNSWENFGMYICKLINGDV